MRIARKYEVIDQVGQGGMGVVYQVRHTDLDTILALKVLPAEWLEDPEMVARFYQEARVQDLEDAKALLDQLSEGV